MSFNKNVDINLFISCHKTSYIPNNKYLVPIQVGKSLNNIELEMLKDNTGDNISKLNPYFCELTAQYWAWKNVDCEYYGFMHYRRFFSFAKKIYDTKAQQTDLFLKGFNNKTLEIINYKESYMKKIIYENDIILPIPSRFYLLDKNSNTVYKQYKESPHHDIKDLDLAIKILLRKHPEYKRTAKKVLNSKQGCFLNMFIMKKEYFNDYCNWLFPILFEFHKKKDYENSSIYSKRAPGLLAERLLNIYIEHLKSTKKIKIKYLQNTFFEDTSDPYLEPLSNNPAICFASNDYYCRFLAIAIRSLIDKSNSSSFYDIIVLNDNISVNNVVLLKKMINNHKNISIRFINIGDYLDNRLTGRDHITTSTYARFAIFDLLYKYKKVLYLDCDVIINDDIAKLFSVDLNNKCAGVVRDSVTASWNSQFQAFGKSQRKYNKEVIGLKNLYDYFNSGVMLLDLVKCKENGITTKYLSSLPLKRKWNWLDQDILNYVLKGKTFFLDSKWNVMVNKNEIDSCMLQYDMPEEYFKKYKEDLLNPSIIHFAGHCQPMFVENIWCGDIFWDYAKKTDYYELLVSEAACYKANLSFNANRGIANYFRWALPPRSFRRKIYRAIYRFIKKIGIEIK